MNQQKIYIRHYIGLLIKALFILFIVLQVAGYPLISPEQITDLKDFVSQINPVIYLQDSIVIFHK